jgi:hypothetical protein
MAIYGTTVAAMATVARVTGAKVPERMAPADLALLTVATYRASRLVSKDEVTSVARAPFTEFEDQAGEGEVNEKARGRGLRRAVGDLISCPFCTAVWTASIGMFGMITFPRAARVACSTLTAVAGSDLLQFGHSALQQHEHGD